MLSAVLKSLLGRGRHARRAEALFEAGLALKDAQDFDGARSKLEQALQLNPDHARARHWLAVILARDPACHAEAARHLEHALAIDPTIPDGWLDLGMIHYLQRDLKRAADSFRAALAIQPDSVLAHSNLGLVLKEAGRLEEALHPLRRAHEIAPEGEGTLRNLVVALVDADLCEEALAVATRAIERNPGSYDAQLFFGFACQKMHRPEQALAHYAIALGMRPADAEFYNNRGVALQHLGRVTEALEDYDRALALEPGFRLAEFHRGAARLMLGDFGGGWPGYESRRASPDFKSISWGLPEWDGSSLSGRTLRIYGEQGLGDEIMFASVLPEVIAAARHCLVECHPKLHSLFARSFPQALVRPASPATGRVVDAGVPEIDWEIPSGSLPRFLRPDRASFPRHRGYLKAAPDRVAYWEERLAQLGPGIKVGISWTGGVRKSRRPVRSITADAWGPVLTTPGARFISLQYTADAQAEAEQMTRQHGTEVVHWPEAIDDYDETAALVCALDLVISVCTSIIHLGGALGRPVWVMTPYSPEWRYGFSGSGMPWYPSVRLFRQPAYGEWKPVISSVAAELRDLANPSARLA